jgi:hypothetical protein
MKLVLVCIVCTLSVTYTNGQNADVHKYIKNNAIRFDVINTAPDFENGIYYSGYVLVLNSLDSVGKLLIKDIKKDQWLSLLRNDESDWAANIILYSLYKKRAAIFWSAVKTRQDWIEKSRKDDLNYWESFLK